MVQLNRILTVLVAASFSLTMFSCASEESSSNVIDIDNATDLTVNMSEYYENMEYIPLETSEKSLVGKIQNVHVTDELIAVVSSGNCHVFDRQTGKFLRKIGMKGNGPNEYNSIVRGQSINGQKNTLLATRAAGPIEYSLIDGSVVEPVIKANIPMFFMGKYMHVADDIWAKGEFNFRGNVPNKLYFFNREKVIDSVANTSFYTPNKGAISFNMGEFYFYRYNNSARYKFAYSDTIFDITSRVMKPMWVLKTQNSMSEIADIRGDFKKMNQVSPNYHSIYNMLETDNYLLFNSGYQKEILPFLFSKNNNQLIKLENDGFVNDIDGGIAFWPTYTTADQEAITVYEAHKFLEEIDATKASDKLKSLVSDIKEEDNPIIAIAQPKK